MKDVTENKPIPIGTMVELTNEKKIKLSNDEGGRLLYITLVN
jgi:non-specific serine/threonine protein kinase